MENRDCCYPEGTERATGRTVTCLACLGLRKLRFQLPAHERRRTRFTITARTQRRGQSCINTYGIGSLAHPQA